MKRVLHVCILGFTVVLVSIITISAQGIPKYSELYSFLIDLNGWKAGEPTGLNMSGPMGEMVIAERDYIKGDKKKLYTQIVGGGPAMGIWAPFETGITFDSPDVFLRVLEIVDFKVGVNHDRKVSSGAVVAQILTGEDNKRGVVFILEYTEMDYKDAINILKEFPLKKIKSAFRR